MIKEVEHLHSPAAISIYLVLGSIVFFFWIIVPQTINLKNPIADTLSALSNLRYVTSYKMAAKIPFLTKINDIKSVNSILLH